MHAALRRHRRAVLAALALLAMMPCCSSVPVYPVLTESGVREEAGRVLACDPLVIKFDQQPPGYDVYVARGCGRIVRLACVESAQGVVSCRPDDWNLPTREGSSADDSDSDSGGCGCGHLFHGKHKANDPPSNDSNPSSTTPQRTKR
jgi:hypothetical protein